VAGRANSRGSGKKGGRDPLETGPSPDGPEERGRDLRENGGWIRGSGFRDRKKGGGPKTRIDGRGLPKRKRDPRMDLVLTGSRGRISVSVRRDRGEEEERGARGRPHTQRKGTWKHFGNIYMDR
jgi:hypothetical protein